MFKFMSFFATYEHSFLTYERDFRGSKFTTRCKLCT